MLIPHSSRSTGILVINMGNLIVRNRFLFADTPGTISHTKRVQTRRKSQSQGDMQSSDLTDCLTTPPTVNTSHSDSMFETLASLPITQSVSRSLLDVMAIELMNIDLFSAEWRDKEDYCRNDRERDMIFPSFVVQRQAGKVLKERSQLTLQVERSLEGNISHDVPDLCIDGTLSSVHFSVDLEQLKLVKGLLSHNLGEPLEDFQPPMMFQLQDPKIQTVLSGDVWKGVFINLQLLNVTLELLIAHDQPEHNCPEASLAKIDFIRSRLLFESYSDGTKDIDLVSHEIKASDVRYTGEQLAATRKRVLDIQRVAFAAPFDFFEWLIHIADSPADARPNVFHEILKPSRDGDKLDSLQLKIHYRSTKEKTLFTILLNNMRLMGIFDWLLACKEFLLTGEDDSFVNKGTCVRGSIRITQLVSWKRNKCIVVVGFVR